VKPIEMLMDEHKVILKVLDALGKYIGRKDPPREDLAKFVKFIREFADACHHGKEEDILFAEMQAQGFPVDMGPLAVMLGEHEEGRRLTRIMAEAAGSSNPLSDADRETVRDAALAYIELLQGHIEKEDNVLYPMAGMHLSQDAWDGIEKRFEEFEEKETGKGEHEELHALAEELIRQYSS